MAGYQILEQTQNEISRVNREIEAEFAKWYSLNGMAGAGGRRTGIMHTMRPIDTINRVLSGLQFDSGSPELPESAITTLCEGVQKLLLGTEFSKKNSIIVRTMRLKLEDSVVGRRNLSSPRRLWLAPESR